MIDLLNITNCIMTHLTYVGNEDMPHYRLIKNTWIITIFC